jgi:prolyl-tRNA synthetase
LVLPPNLSPYQVVIIPIYRNDEEKSVVLPTVARTEEMISDSAIRVKVDDREEVTPGFKFNDWEMRGVPLRIEIGPRDVAKNNVAFARRDILGRKGKSFISQDDLVAEVKRTLNQIQNNLLEKAKNFRDENIHEAADKEALMGIVKQGWALCWWCGETSCEAAIKAATKATNRCMPLDQTGETGVCVYCGESASERTIFARAY